MKIYKVGGYVRDTLLNLKPNDTDYVVVDSSVQEMLSLGYHQVGKDFPVFLHPETREEYALARTERSTGPRYSDFKVTTDNVTLEDDLLRRDLTINAIAMDTDGTIIDPYNGQLDLERKTLRHTSIAFIEDPLRVLRLARIRARYGPHWKIAAETKLLVDSIKPLLKELHPNRVYTEVQKVMKSPNSHLFFTTLDELNVLDAIFPYIYDLKSYREGSVWHQEPNVFEHTMAMLKLADHESPTIKYMILYHDIAKPVCRRLYGNGSGHDSAELAEPRLDIQLPTLIKHAVLHHVQVHQRIFKLDSMSPKKIVKLIKSFHKDRQLLDDVLKVSYYDKHGSIRLKENPPTDLQPFVNAFEAISTYSPVEWMKIQPTQPTANQIKDHIHRMNLKFVQSIMKGQS